MKILRLRLENLNSLYGEWAIDFTDPAFQDSGLFAITGPTGGGKSTVLDAICLALYGETPRLKSINASSNEIMSRHTGESYSELEYEINGKQYLSRWYQKRARSKADGALQSVKREISIWNEASGSYDGIANKLKDVDKAVQEITRMDFERFTRSILLAQGNFAAFLEANDDARAGLLEQITGTDIYTKISQQVHERYSVETQKLKEIEARMGSIDLLSDEAVSQLATEQESYVEEVQELTKKRNGLTEKIHWLQGVAELERKTKENTKLLNTCAQKEKDFTEKRLLLKAAKRASRVDLFFNPVRDSRATILTIETKRKSVSGQLAVLKEDLVSDQKALEGNHQSQRNLEADLVIQKPIWQQVRALDTKLEGVNAQFDSAKENVRSAGELLEKEKQQAKSLTARLGQLTDELKTTKNYLETNLEDKAAFETHTVIQHHLSQWSQQHEQLGVCAAKSSDNKARLVKGRGVIKAQVEAVEGAKREQAQAEKALVQTKAELEKILAGKLLRELNTERKHLYEKKEYEVKIQSLESHRSQLEDGKPCPLCGAEDHPFTHGGTELHRSDSIEQEINAVEQKIERVNQTEKSVAKSENTLEIAKKNYQQMSSKLNDYNERIEELEESEKSLGTELSKFTQSREKVEKILLQELEPILGGREISAESLDGIGKSVQQKAELWKSAVTKAEPLQSAIQKVDSEITVLKVKIDSLSATSSKAEQELGKVSAVRVTISEERNAIFSSKSVDETERAFQTKLSEATQRLNDAKTTLHRKEKALTKLEQSRAELESQAVELNTKLADGEKNLAESLQAHEFVDEASYLSAKQASDTVKQLELADKTLETERETLTALSMSLKQDLVDQQAKKLTKETNEELAKKLDIAERTLTEKNQLLGTIKEKLANHEKNLGRQQKDAAEKLEQQGSLKIWKHLHTLIGSAEGKRYRNYAQGLTFEWVVNYANIQLESITDRYILTRDKDAPLQLNVLDNYQGGEERSTQNLSGGESFLISLALALGLSRMVSDSIQMDSLFLDEGFGTLDEETLELAMDALSSLRQEGKLIGVISHVQELKERITTQIVVAPQSGGKSELSGAGISRD